MATIEDTRAIVDEGEHYEGKIYPTSRDEIGRSVRLHEEATVDGSVYGSSVELSAGAAVEGSVMGSEAVEIRGGRVERETGSPGKVVAEDTELYGSVTGTRVTISDSIVHGNVVGDDVTVEDSIVVGIVAADRSLTVSSSLCYTFKAMGEATVDDAKILFPQAIVDGAYDLETPVDIVGVQLTDPESGEQATLTDADTLTRDGTRYLTLAPRLLDIESVADRLDELEGYLRELVVGSSTTADTRAFLDALGVEDIDIEDVGS